MADSYDILNDYDLSKPESSYPEAIKAANEALTLDPTLAEAHATLASVKAQYEWNWLEAEAEFKQAIKLKPTYATAHQWYSEFLLRCGRFDEAISEIKRAQELDPLSPIINAEIGGYSYFARRYDEAIQKLRAYLQTEPGLGYAHSWLGMAYSKKQMFSDAIAEFENAISISGESPSFKANLGYVLGLSGQKHKARAIAEELEARRKKYFSAYSMALVYIGLDEPDLAVQRLEDAFNAHDPALNLIKIDPALDSLRSDPRFKNLQQRIGL